MESTVKETADIRFQPDFSIITLKRLVDFTAINPSPKKFFSMFPALVRPYAHVNYLNPLVDILFISHV